MEYKISVIIPVYNKEKYLDQCLKSVVNQTLENIEIVIVNDGSTDKSGEIIKKYGEKYKNIKVIEQENKGVIEARIVGYENATGKYIGWVDADDFIDCDMYKELYESAENGKFDIAICNYKFYPNNTNKKNVWFCEFKGKKDYNFLRKSTLQWNKIVKKELLEKVNIVSLFKTMGEGSYTMVLLNTDKIITVNKKMYNYRIGHESLSTNYNNCEWYEKNVVKAKNRLEIIKKSKFSQEWSEYFEYSVFYSILLMLIIAINCNEKELYEKYKKELEQQNYKKNKYTKLVLEEDRGKLKTFVLINIIPNSYFLSLPIVKIFLKGK